MIIRCERCSTLYELDEALLSPEGSSVQCAKCQAIFTATPPRPGAPAQVQAAPASARHAPAPPSGPVRPADATPPPARPARQGPNIYRPPQPAAVAASPVRARPGAPARDAVSAIEARLRNLGRWRLAAIPLGAVLLLALAWGGWSAWKRRPDPDTQRQLAEASALIALDDAASLARAVELLDSIQQGDHPSSQAAGERGLARALLATAQADEVEPLAERLAGALAERARLDRERPPGFEDAQRAVSMEVTRLEVELAPRRKKLEVERNRAAEELKAVAAGPKGAQAAARGQAVLGVLDSNPEEVERTAGLLRAAGPDPWADLVEHWLAVRRDGAARDQAIPRLAALVGAHGELIRARFVLARALLSAGRREEAISTVNGLLAASPRHERAARLRAQLAAPPPVQPPPPVAVPPPRPAALPRPALPPPPPPPAAVNLVAPAPVVVQPPAVIEQPLPEAPPSPAPAYEVPLPPPPTLPRPREAPPEPYSAPDPTQG